MENATCASGSVSFEPGSSALKKTPVASTYSNLSELYVSRTAVADALNHVDKVKKLEKWCRMSWVSGKKCHVLRFVLYFYSTKWPVFWIDSSL